MSARAEFDRSPAPFALHAVIGERCGGMFANVPRDLEQSRNQPLVCPVSLHPFVAGRPYRIRRLHRAFEHIAAHRDEIWLTRPRDICAHIESLPPGTVPV